MRNQTPKDKGEALEIAVHWIEFVILQEATDYVDKCFAIERGKIISVEGVRHEIDVFVRVEIAEGYEAIFIFECKNWKVPIGKNEIIIFSEKIRACGATKGFFVATDFTADARAQASKDPRLQLLIAQERHYSVDTAVELPIVVLDGPQRATVNIVKRGSSGNRCSPIEFLTVALDGVEWPPDRFLRELTETTINEELSKYGGSNPVCGEFDATGRRNQRYSEGRLLVNGDDIESIDVSVEFRVRVFRPIVRSYFDVEKRGRCHRAENFFVGDCEVAIGFVKTESDSGQ